MKWGEYRFPHGLSVSMSVHSLSIHLIFPNFSQLSFNWLEISYIHICYIINLYTYKFMYTYLFSLCNTEYKIWQNFIYIFVTYKRFNWCNTDQVWLLFGLAYFHTNSFPLLKLSFPNYSLPSLNIYCHQIWYVNFLYWHNTDSEQECLCFLWSIPAGVLPL